MTSLSFIRPIAAVSGLVALAAASFAGSASAEPMACLSQNPADWPAPSKPYFLIAFDTSGSMARWVPCDTADFPPMHPLFGKMPPRVCGANEVTTQASCEADACYSLPSCPGYPANRTGHGRCALKNTVNAFAGQVNFGLAAFAKYIDTSQQCFGCPSGCTFLDFPGNSGPSGCGPEPDPSAPLSSTRQGANILVPLQPDDYWNSPSTGSNVAEMLKWVDGDCSDHKELWHRNGAAINGFLLDTYKYLSTQWASPLGGQPLVSPLGTVAQGERDCRSLNVILVTDGDEDCDRDKDPATPENDYWDPGGGKCPAADPLCYPAAAKAAQKLLQGFTKGGISWTVKTHVIRFAGAKDAEIDFTNKVAEMGGTGAAIPAGDEVALSKALAGIIAGSVAPETCDNKDNNCNGCTDEGSKRYCNVQPQAADCCAWGTSAQRSACLTSYQASISAATPQGDKKLLPCTTPAQQQDPASWLCFDPGDVCDSVDNNCQAGADESITKCGSPLHCPAPESCNGQDDDCDGQVDEGGVCAGNCLVTPSPEICDGCDNDCDGIADNGIPAIPCGLPSPPACSGQITCKAPQMVQKGGCVPNGGFNACNNTTSAEQCNGIDDNCNGAIDDGVVPIDCVPQGQPGNLVYGGTSQCQKGKLPCNGTCQGFVGPTAEICDGIDNDCDGQVDEAGAAPGGLGGVVGQPCGINQLPCKPGLTACVNGALVCQGGVPPQSEVCDGIDNDCDKQVDELPLADGPAQGQNGCWNLPAAGCQNPCSFKGLTWCPPPGATCKDDGTLKPPCNNGTLKCGGASGWTCQGAKPPIAEACNGIDDDCNGSIDDGDFPQEGQKCGSDEGECNSGTIECVLGLLDCVNDLPPTKEKCDGLDNDCDGVVDNAVSAGETCDMPYDVMAYPGNRSNQPCKPGLKVCNGQGGLACVGGIAPSPEICDGIDNDCDGVIDEAGAAPDGVDGTANPLPPPAVNIGDACGDDTGECKAGVYGCENGLFVCKGSVPKAVETCDCLDNDCDGSTDNPNQGEGAPALCGMGKECVKAAGGYCQCAALCDGEFGCPPGQVCEVVVSSLDGQPKGSRCVVDCGDCSTQTVKDVNGDIVCGPAGTERDGCEEVPVCVCKGQSGCQSPCLGVVCEGTNECAKIGPKAGQCAPNNCWNQPCKGCGKVCNLGACVDNPCTPTSCDFTEECVPSADFSTFTCIPSCLGKNCPDGQTCVKGDCVDDCDPPCAEGEVCDKSKSPAACVPDKCNPNPCDDGAYCDPATGQCGNYPCEGVVCPFGQRCEEGSCVLADTTTTSSSSTGTGGSKPTTSSSSSSSTGAGGAGGSPDNGVWGLATGRGCSCEIGVGAADHGDPGGPSPDPRWALAALAAAVGFGRLRGRGRTSRDSGEVA